MSVSTATSKPYIAEQPKSATPAKKSTPTYNGKPVRLGAPLSLEEMRVVNDCMSKYLAAHKSQNKT